MWIRAVAKSPHTPKATRCLWPSTILLLSAALPAPLLRRIAEDRGGRWWALLSLCAMAHAMLNGAGGSLHMCPWRQGLDQRVLTRKLCFAVRKPNARRKRGPIPTLGRARPRGGVCIKDNLLPRFPSGPVALATFLRPKRGISWDARCRWGAGVARCSTAVWAYCSPAQ
jgi:hypothetical protein